MKRPRRDYQRPSLAKAELCELEVLRVGTQGDGVAEGPVYVPFTLPGERVRARVQAGRGELVEVLAPSAERQAPPCPHFFTCGGCALQHWAAEPPTPGRCGPPGGQPGRRARRPGSPAPGLKPIAAEARDLFRRPVLAQELKGIQAVVFDPPRAGAEAQAAQIAQSAAARAVGVSCNPATFARDARILVDAGFTLERVLPVDQFLWSPHVELVGVFGR